MVSIIIYDKQGSEGNSAALIEQVNKSGNQAILVGAEKPSNLSADSFIDANSGSMYDQFIAAAQIASSRQLLLFNGSLDITADSFEELIAAADSQSNSLAVASFGKGDSSFSLPAFSTKDLSNSITSTKQWPLAILSINKDTLNSLMSIEADSFSVFTGRILIEAAANDLGIGSLSANIEATNMEAISTLSQEETAQLLEHAVNTYNIEDLFPNHSWDKFSEESAAACYHTLAAKFIVLNDYESAQQCLSFSDSLEDSPRSQGLKAIISIGQGETLGAVANLVSSLQQYEVRKAESNTEHYLSFSPSNLEVINDNLHQGLSALNKRDNESALEHFANAVFNFDSFYGDNGIDNIKDKVM